MADLRNILKNKYEISHRYRNFGEILQKIRLINLRPHRDTLLELQSSVTALCGLNGTGKSTILQAFACAYKSLGGRYPTHYFSNYIKKSQLDPGVGGNYETRISYEYCMTPGSASHSGSQSLTIARNWMSDDRWNGYRRRPRRCVYMIGTGFYLSKVEKTDFFFRHSEEVSVSESQHLSQTIHSWINRILHCDYEEAQQHKITHRNQNGIVRTLKRNGNQYSEVHMGCGEGRIPFLISSIESIPEDKSLILLEEPETSLHPYAQYELARYLMDVCNRKGHQVVITTHSEDILKALPSESRILLKPSTNGIVPVPGLTALQARSIMAEGHTSSLWILVEDECAKIVLTEIIRKVDPTFLSTVKICVGGDEDQLSKAARALRQTNLPIAVVKDGDMTEDRSDSIFKLPGTLPPEKELFNCIEVKTKVQSDYHLNLNDFSTSLTDINNHDWWSRIAERIQIDEKALLNIAAKEYAATRSTNICNSLVDGLKDCAQ